MSSGIVTDRCIACGRAVQREMVCMCSAQGLWPQHSGTAALVATLATASPSPECSDACRDPIARVCLDGFIAAIARVALLVIFENVQRARERAHAGSRRAVLEIELRRMIKLGRYARTTHAPGCQKLAQLDEQKVQLIERAVWHASKLAAIEEGCGTEARRLDQIQVWPAMSDALRFKLGNLRIIVGWLAELVTAGELRQVTHTMHPQSAFALSWEQDVLAAAECSAWAAQRLRTDVKCGDLDALDMVRTHLLTRAVALLLRLNAHRSATLIAELVTCTEATPC